ncbi:hypothetical protein [Fontibacillus sp. BL9]|uniref:hypothetical protein n=1 Tax=Fontibacillus sp. BL9 TaxID=3389971 RepID=UPI003977EB1D
MSNYYAQLNEEGRVIGLSDLSEPTEADNMIPIEEAHFNIPLLLRMRYMDGTFTGTVSNLKANKDSIVSDGAEILTVELTVTDWRGEIQEDFSEEVQLEMNDLQQSISVSKGQAAFTISSEEPGEFRLRTLGLDRNAELKVVVTDGK